MSENKIDFKIFFGLLLLTMIVISFLLIPLININLLRQVVFKWLVIYLLSILGVLIVNNKLIHSKTIDLLIMFVSPISWLLYGSAAIWYIRLFSMDWFWFVVYPGFVFGLAIVVLFTSKERIAGMNMKSPFWGVCVIPAVLGLMRCFLWGGDIISWNRILLLVLMNFTGAIQLISIGSAVVLAIKDNYTSKKLAEE